MKSFCCRRLTPFENPSLFLRLHCCERVAGIEPGVAKQEVDRTVILRRAGFRRDLDSCTARPVVFGGVGIIVDGYCLDRRSRQDAGTLNAIHNQSDAVRSERAAVQKARHRGHDILIEDRQIIQSLPINRGYIAVLAGIGADFRRVSADRDLLVEIFDE